MVGNLGKLVVGLAVLTLAADAEAGGRFVYTTNFPFHYYSGYSTSHGGFAPYYYSYAPYYAPQGVLSAPAFTAPAFTTPAFTAPTPAFTAPSPGGGVTAAEFQQFVTQYNQDIGDIKTKLGRTPAPANPGGASNVPGGPTTQPGRPQPGTAVAPQAAPPAALPNQGTTSLERLDRIIQRLESIKIDR